MKIKVLKGTEYGGEGNPTVEGFFLEVESEHGDNPGSIIETYLKLRRKLQYGIKEKRGRPLGKKNKEVANANN